MKAKHVLKIVAAVAGICASYYYQKQYTIKIDRIYVEGCKHFPARLIHDQIKAHITSNPPEIFKVQRLVNQCEYVSKCVVRFAYPRTLWVHVQEKEPIAQTIKGQIICSDLSVINSTPLFSSRLLKIDAIHLDSGLLKFIDAMKKHNIKADLCTLIRPGRWDLLLDGKIIKLPDDQEEVGLLTLKWFKKYHSTLFAHASQIDLRKIGYVLFTEYSSQNVEDWISSI